MSTPKKKLGRYDELAKKINLGLNIDEKSGQSITDWTPNNIKTLIIGIDMALIGYYVTGGRFKHKFDGATMKLGKINDYEIMSSGDTPKAILKVLTGGRVCSNIQEIIFISDNYPQQLMHHDSNLSSIASEGNLKTKFPRLKYVGVATNLTMQDALKYLQLANKEEKLIEEILEENKQTLQKIEVNGADYNRTYVVRPHHYNMDDGALREYFLKEKTRKAETTKKDALKEKTLELYGKDLKQIDILLLTYIQYRNRMVSASSMGFSDLSALAKLEWGYMLEERYNNSILAKEIRSRDKMLADLRKINYAEVASYLDEASLSGMNAKKFQSFIFTDVLKSEDEYKRETNKHTLGESLKVFKGILRELLEIQANIVYMIYSRYLAQNGMDYVLHFYNKVEQCVAPQNYTQKTARLANKHLKEQFKEQLNDVFKTIGGQEILAQDLNLKEMLEETTNIVLNIPRMG